MTFEIILFFLLATIINSIGDALKFSGATKKIKYDVLWHFIKYFIQIPLWMFSGYFLFTYININNLWDFWHPKSFHLYLILLIAVGTLLWQVFYIAVKVKLEKWTN